jgi:predicted metal-dependent TIM-barrel fold hydrolase
MGYGAGNEFDASPVGREQEELNSKLDLPVIVAMPLRNAKCSAEESVEKLLNCKD